MARVTTLEIDGLRVVATDGEVELESYDSANACWDLIARGDDAAAVLRELLAFIERHATKAAG